MLHLLFKLLYFNLEILKSLVKNLFIKKSLKENDLNLEVNLRKVIQFINFITVP